MNPPWDISKSALSQLNDGYYDIIIRSETELTKKLPDIIIVTGSSLPDDQIAFLHKVMNSVAKTATDFTIIDSFEYQNLSPGQTILSFTPHLTDQSQFYTPRDFKDGKICLFDSVVDIMVDNSKKRLLWECLKTTF